MPKFEKYDKVCLNKDLEDYELIKGEEGRIMSDLIDGDHYAVAFDFDDETESLLHTCEGLVPSGKGLFVAEIDLEKV